MTPQLGCIGVPLPVELDEDTMNEMAIEMEQVVEGVFPPVPEDKVDYIGTWVSDDGTTTLTIEANGGIARRTVSKWGSGEVSGAIRVFEDDRIITGPVLRLTFRVDTPPTWVNGVWRMVIDGVPLIRA